MIEGEPASGRPRCGRPASAVRLARGSTLLATRCGENLRRSSRSRLRSLLETFFDHALPAAAAAHRGARPPPTNDTLPARRRTAARSFTRRARDCSNHLHIGADPGGHRHLQWLDQSSARYSVCARRVRRRAARHPRLAPDRRHIRRTCSCACDAGRRSAGWRSAPCREVELAPDHPRTVRGRTSPSIMRRVHLAAGGNPFYAVDRARGPPSSVPWREKPPVPDDLTDLLRRRVTALPIDTQTTLLVAASTSRPTRRVVRSASVFSDRADSALAFAESARRRCFRVTI